MGISNVDSPSRALPMNSIRIDYESESERTLLLYALNCEL